MKILNKYIPKMGTGWRNDINSLDVISKTLIYQK